MTVAELLSRCERRTRREVEETLVSLSPQPIVRSQIRKKPPSAIEPAAADLYNFRFSANEAFRDKLERLAEVLGMDAPAQRMPELIEKALDLALEAKDPKRKYARRLKRERSRSRSRPAAEQPPHRPNDVVARGPGARSRSRSRYIASAQREQALERAGYQCEFRGSGGRRCTQRTHVEIDHIELFCRGGTHSLGNLRVLCRAHNQFCATESLGEEVVARRIESRRGGFADLRSVPQR